MYVFPWKARSSRSIKVLMESKVRCCSYQLFMGRFCIFNGPLTVFNFALTPIVNTRPTLLRPTQVDMNNCTCVNDAWVSSIHPRRRPYFIIAWDTSRASINFVVDNPCTSPERLHAPTLNNIQHLHRRNNLTISFQGPVSHPMLARKQRDMNPYGYRTPNRSVSLTEKH